MNEEKIQQFLQAIEGIKMHEWSRIKQKVDMHFSSEAAKVQLDDSPELKRNLEVEFNLRRFGEKNEALEKQVAAGTATQKEFSSQDQIIQLKENGICRIDNVVEGYQFEGPGTIIVVSEIS